MTTLPPDPVFRLLHALVVGIEFVTVPETGRMVILFDSLYATEVDGESLDELFARGWAVLEGDRIKVTEAGRYWLARWRAKRKARAA